MNWPNIEGLEMISSPALLVDSQRISKNIDQMIQIAGDNFKGRLRPHLKTHKMSKVTQLQIDKGINKFKSATISEAKMAARLHAKDILLAFRDELTRFGDLAPEIMNSYAENRTAD